MKRLLMILLATQVICPSAAGAQRPPGRWEKTADTLSVEQEQRIEQLKALGYLAGSFEASVLTGVTIHDESRAYQGLNFYTSGHGYEAILMDMEGNVLHKWAYDGNQLWFRHPRIRVAGQKVASNYWRRAYLFENGDLVIVYTGQGMAKIDKDSNLLWATPEFLSHHDLDIAPNGDIYVGDRKVGLLKRVHPFHPIMEDCISILDPQGRHKRKVSVIKSFENSDEYRSIWENRPVEHGDVLHLNTIELLEGGKKVLTSMRNLDVIAIIDMEQEEVVWAFQERFRGPHEPTMLPNGNILLFNNNWSLVEDLPQESSVLEYKFPSMELVWEYRGTADDPFYSYSCGAAQRLPNGNTLITESDGGRALEVTPEGETVWEFYSPHRAGENNELVATLFDMDRLPPDFPLDWLEK